MMTNDNNNKNKIDYIVFHPLNKKSDKLLYIIKLK